MSATTPMRRKRATNLRQGEDDDSGELVRKRNARMAVFSALVDCTPSTSTNNNNNNRNYHEEDEEDDEPRTTLLKSMSLKSLLKLKCETINKFLNFFDATHQARSNSKDPKYPIDLLPVRILYDLKSDYTFAIKQINIKLQDRLEFHVMFRGAMSGENCPFMQAIRISSVSDETLRKAASATVHFFSFMTLRRNKVKERPSVPQCDYEMERVKRMTTVEKANLVGEFFCWFERVPPVRVSSSKVVATNGVKADSEFELDQYETHSLQFPMNGTEVFSPKSIGCEYPLVSSDNGEDWSLNVAVVLAMLSCLVGTTRAEQYFCDYGELAESGEEIELTVRKSELNDTPLFRESNKYHNLLPGQMRNVHNALSLVAKSLKIPPALFSSRSYRSGYARDVIQGIVTRGDPQRDIPLQALRSNLLSGTQWKSAQVDRYLSNLSRSLALHPVTFAHTTALDWQSAIYGELASTKSDFEEVNPTNVNIYIRSKSSKPDESLARLSSMDPAEIITLCDEINIDNWRKCAPVPLTHQERREFLQKNTMVDVFSTFQSLKMVIDQNMRPFCGYGVSSPYACPVVNCGKSGALHSLASTHEHWKLWHEESKKNLTYMCIKCSNTGPSNLKSYSRHLKIRHKMEPFNFNFSFI
ncbi:Protein CBG23548 [Caenorhabditis briggsae]|uniref:Protein CBG23548 n=1 Tax=Caenorhabditis briggsae TaxID=6238 RepID=A8Y4U1_CAEBR|nr:Protein CBG23548 [Caenorhabditis briggsae]CAP39910.2 Protein CBG23548 [Caenorhabditis briggsae]